MNGANKKNDKRYEKDAREMKEEFREFGSFGKFGQIGAGDMSQPHTSKGCQNANLEKSDVSNSKTSISACSCGPECGPDKCDGRSRAVLVSWDSLRTKLFIFFFVAFMVWLVVYVPISLTILGN